MELYEKEVSKSGKVTYKKHDPTTNTLVELEQDQVVSLLTTFTLAMLMSVSGQLKDHSRAAREIRKVEESIINLAKLNKSVVDAQTLDLGVTAWNAAIKALGEGK